MSKFDYVNLIEEKARIQLQKLKEYFEREDK